MCYKQVAFGGTRIKGSFFLYILSEESTQKDCEA
jgi:hypothetical protein